MTNEWTGQVEAVAGFIEAVDTELGQASEEAVQSVFDALAEYGQPAILGLLASIAAGHDVDPDELAECLFHLYTLQRYYADRLGSPPPVIGPEVLETAIEDVERDLERAGLMAVESGREFNPLALPCLAEAPAGAFFTVWRQHLTDMLDRGEVDDNLYFDLLRFYLTVLKSFTAESPGLFP